LGEKLLECTSDLLVFQAQWQKIAAKREWLCGAAPATGDILVAMPVISQC
jgi:hypothetical protein